MKHILVIDNNIDPNSHGCADIVRSIRTELSGQSNLDIVVRRGPEQHYSLQTMGVAGVVISGSKTRALDNAPWIDTQMNFVRQLRNEKIPTLGICYGEQLMAKTFGGDTHLRRAPTCEFGFVEISCTAAANRSALFRGLGTNFHSFCYHYDEVQKLPPGFILTAVSAACEIHAFDIADAPMWGIQFHPEKNLEEAKNSMAHIQKADPSVPLLNRDHADTLFDPNVVRVLFRNFIRETGKYSQ